MGTKIYNIISAVLKLICVFVVGFIGVIALYKMPFSIIPMYAGPYMEILRFLFLAFAISGYIGMAIRSGTQIVMLFRTVKTNTEEMLCIDVLVLIGVALGYSELSLYFEMLAEEGATIFSYLYWLSLLLTLIDIAILFVNVKNQQLKILTEKNCTIIVKKATRVVIPMLVLCVVMTLNTMIKENLKIISLDESLKGGFDSFTMCDFDGNEYTEEVFKGHKVTMINIWGTFCHPCIEEMPNLEKISKMYDESEFQIIGIAGDLYVSGKVDQGQVDEATRIIDSTGVKYLMLIPSSEIQQGIIANINAYPTTIFLNENGEQLDMVQGAYSTEDWITTIEGVLANEK